MVIRTHSVEFMPFLLSLFNFMNGLVWFGYAFVGHVDIFIMVSILTTNHPYPNSSIPHVSNFGSCMLRKVM
jgi:hypothetical protein